MLNIYSLKFLLKSLEPIHQLHVHLVLFLDSLVSISELVLNLFNLYVAHVLTIFGHVDTVERHSLLDFVTDVSETERHFLFEVPVLGLIFDVLEHLPLGLASSMTKNVLKP